jgi:hypothetical protein
MQFLALALLALPALVAAAPTQTYTPSWSHFATEEANKNAPFYDLTEYGIKNGVLPKNYNLANGTGIVYDANASWELFQEVLAGKWNRTNVPDYTDALAKRNTDACGGIDFQLSGSCGGFSYSNQCVDPATCVNQGGCQWSSVNVFSVSNAYITFWASSACNGSKGSFNPHCNQNTGQGCQLNLQWKSFRVYGGCHDNDQSNC